MRCASLILLLLAFGCERPCPPPASQPASRPAHAQDKPLEPVAVRPFALGEPELVLLITGATLGRMEVCNCSGPMPGGLSRRSGLFASYRQAHRAVAAIDTGDAFWLNPQDLRNRYMLPAYQLLDYHAVVLGDHEWRARQQLGDMLRAAPVKCLSTNVRAEGLDLPSAAVIPAGARKLAVLSFVGPGALSFMPEEERAQLTILDVARVDEQAAGLKAEGCAVLLVAHVDEWELAGLKSLRNVDIIIRGHTSQSEDKPERLGAMPVIRVGSPEFVGVLALKLGDGRIAAWEYRAEIVDTSWPLDRRLMNVYQAYAHEALRQALDADKKLGLYYVSSATCGKCHVQQYQAWQQDKHSRAWKTLVDNDRTYDPSCVMCHTSGFGTAEGFRSPRETPALSNINCMDCHRLDFQAGRHRGKPDKTVKEDTCTICHTPVNSPAFEYDKYRPHVGCVWSRTGPKPTTGPAKTTTTRFVDRPVPSRE